MTHRLRIDEAGAIETDDGARAWLARRAGSWQLARTSPELLLGLRLEPRDELPLGRVGFCGDFDGLPFPDLVTLLAQGRRTGMLRVIGPERAARGLFFAGGDLHGATSNVPGERLGEVAVRLELVPAGGVAQILSSPMGGGRIGRRLVDAGLLDPARLASVVEEQVKAVFQAILVRPAGAFAFEDRPAPPDAAGPLVAAQALLLDGLRCLDELAHYRQLVPSGGAVVRLAVPDAARAEPLEDEVARALRGAPLTVGELARELRRPELDVTRAVHHLAERGEVEVSAGAGAGALEALGASPSALREIVRGFNRVFREIASELLVAGAGGRFREAADEAMHGMGHPLLGPEVRFGADGTLPADPLLERLPEVSELMGRGPRAVLLEALQPLPARLMEEAQAALPADATRELQRRVQVIFGMIEW